MRLSDIANVLAHKSVELNDLKLNITWLNVQSNPVVIQCRNDINVLKRYLVEVMGLAKLAE